VYALEIWVDDRTGEPIHIVRNCYTQYAIRGPDVGFGEPEGAHFEKVYSCDRNGRVLD